MKRIIGLIILFLLRLFMIILCIFLLLQTSLARNIIRKTVEKTINQQLDDGILTIGSLQGNLFSRIRLRNIRLQSDQQEIFSLKELSIRFDPISILKKKIQIDQLVLDSPRVNLSQDNEKVWNFQKLIKSEQKGSSLDTDRSAQSEWLINIDDLILNEGSINISETEKTSFLPDRIEGLGIRLNACYHGNEMRLKLKSMQFITRNPELNLKDINLIVSLKDEIITVDTLLVSTAENSIEATSCFNGNDPYSGKLSFKVLPLKLSEFVEFLPGLPRDEFPEIFLEISAGDKKILIRIHSLHQQQQLDLIAIIDFLPEFPEYSADLRLVNFNPGYWLADDDFDSDINLLLRLNGQGFDPQVLESDLEIVFEESRIGTQILNSLQINLIKKAGDADFSLSLLSEAGSINSRGKVSNIFAVPEYELTIETSDLNISRFNSERYPVSNLDISLKARGSGTDLNGLQTSLDISSYSSEIAGIEIDTLRLSGNFDKGSYLLENLFIKNPEAEISAQGKGILKGSHEIFFRIGMTDLERLRQQLLPDEQVSVTGEITGSLFGTIDDLQLESNISLPEINYRQVKIADFTAVIEAAHLPHDPEFNLQLDTGMIRFDDHLLNELSLTSQGTPDSLYSLIDIAADSLNFSLETVIVQDTLLIIIVPELHLDYKDISLNSRSTPTEIMIGKDFYQISELELENGQGLIKIAGLIENGKAQDLNINLTDLDLSQLTDSGLLVFPIDGKLNFVADISGNCSNPDLTSVLEINDFSLNDQSLPVVKMAVNLKDKLLDSEFEIWRTNEQQITGSARLPLLATICPVEVSLVYDQPVEIDLLIDSWDISFLEEFIDEIQSLKGDFHADLQVRNTLSQPDLSGKIRLNDGIIDIPQYGMLYPKMRLHSSFHNQEILLEEFYLAGGDGNLKAFGKAVLQDSIQAGLDYFELSVQADNFTAAGKRELFLLTDLALELQGNTTEIDFNGNMNIPKARVDLAAFQSKTSGSVQNEPLLVQALKQNGDIDTLKVIRKQKKTGITDKLKGQIRIKIPRNTWIRNREMNIELGGDLEVIKQGRDFEIFGYIKILRGSYQIYGKKFDLLEGTVTFSGGKEINPLLDIRVRNIIRDINRNHRQLIIHLQNKAMNPTITFFLDNTEITEADAISYLLFGKSSTEISQGEKSQLESQSKTELAGVFLARQIGSEIASQISRTLNLDVLEFSGGDNWKKASILVGKYITNNLFLSYQKEFSLAQTKEIASDIITLEYEISRHFSIQATQGDEKTTGFDFFWKFDQR